MPTTQTVTTNSLPQTPTMGNTPVILSISNPYPGDPTRVIRPKQGLGIPPAHTSDSFPTSNVTLPVSGMGVAPGVLPAPTPIPGRLPTKVHVPKKKNVKKEDKPKEKAKDPTTIASDEAK